MLAAAQSTACVAVCRNNLAATNAELPIAGLRVELGVGGLVSEPPLVYQLLMTYKVGDEVNGHVLGADNAWHPVPPPETMSPTTPPTPPTSSSMEIKGHTGTVLWDGDFVSIKRTGFLARSAVGKGEKRIPLASITAVQWKPAGPMVNGYIQFTVGGGNERRSAFGSQTTSAVKDENSVVFTKGQMAACSELRTAIEQAIVERARPATAAFASSPDHMAQLRQLAELRDSGVVTPSEFEAKKAEILARM